VRLCCLLPALIAAGVIGSAGWVAVGAHLPSIVGLLALITAVVWWWTRRAQRPQHICPGGESSCHSVD
jgi:hypothetical protein